MRDTQKTPFTPEFLENGQRDPHKNSGQTEVDPYSISHPMMILIRVRPGELFAINGRKMGHAHQSKNIDGPVYDGAHNNTTRRTIYVTTWLFYTLSVSLNLFPFTKIYQYKTIITCILGLHWKLFCLVM